MDPDCAAIVVVCTGCSSSGHVECKVMPRACHHSEGSSTRSDRCLEKSTVSARNLTTIVIHEQNRPIRSSYKALSIFQFNDPSLNLRPLSKPADDVRCDWQAQYADYSLGISASAFLKGRVLPCFLFSATFLSCPKASDHGSAQPCTKHYPVRALKLHRTLLAGGLERGRSLRWKAC